MPSSYSTNLKIELQATGENSGTWGTITNTNLGTALEQAIVGYGNPNYASDANLTLTYTDTNAAQAARALVLNVTSSVSLSTTRELVVPTIQKQYIVQNNTTGSQSITVKTSAGTGITVPNGRKAHLYVDGTNVIYMDDYVDINGGAIDGTPIGANSASTGAFSTLSATGNVNFDGGTFTFNDSGADRDFRVEGDTDANLLFSDASTDRIGIGTNTPASKLDVNGTITATAVNTTTLDLTNLEVTNIKAKDGTSAASIADSTGVVSFTANPILSGGTANGVLYLNGSKVATSGTGFVFDGTNVGVGTSSPTNVGGYKSISVNGTDGSLIDSFYNGTLTGRVQAYSGGYFVSSQGASVPLIFGQNNTEGMRLTSTGLGIGTSSPASKLHVSNTAAATRITITDDVAAGRSGYIESNYSDALVIGTTSGVRGIRFSPDNTPRMYLDTSGNLGIGTSSPTHKLQTNGAGRFGTMTTGPGLLSGSSDTFQVGLNQDNTNTTNTQVWAEYVNGATSASWAVRYRAANDTGTASTRLFLDAASGNLGLGVTPSAWSASFRALQVGGSTALWGITSGAGSTFLSSNTFFDGAYKYLNTGTATYYAQSGGSHTWNTAPSGTAGNAITFTQAMTLDASGNLGVGTTSPSSIFEVKSATPIITLNGTTNASARGLNFQGNGTLFGSITANYSTGEMKIASGASGLSNYYLTFFTDNTERARITSGGYFKASNDGTYQGSTSSYHELRSTGAAGDWNTVVTNTTATGANAYGIRIAYTGSAPNGTGNAFLSCDDNASGATTRAVIRSNGGLANYQSNNVDLSDARTKKDITPAASMWDKIGALEIVTYKYNDQTHDDVNVGVIAQQVEAVEPVWVDNDGFGETPEGEEPLKTVYTKDIYFAAIKALQEAMARIEKLEAEMAALKGA